MNPYKICFTKEAVKDVKKLSPQLKTKLRSLLINIIAPNPYSGKRLVGDLSGFFSLRLSYKDRIVYTIDEKQHTVFIHRTRTHYGE